MIYRMSLKKYLTYSFVTLWTVVLIIALIATLIHQVNFQDSAKELHLNFQVATLESNNQELGFQNQRLQNSLDQSEIKYYTYRQWVMSWR